MKREQVKMGSGHRMCPLARSRTLLAALALLGCSTAMAQKVDQWVDGIHYEMNENTNGEVVVTRAHVPGIYYGLQMVEGKLGFLKLNAGDTLLPNIAYVRDQEVADIVFSGNTTGISTMTAADDQAPRYDLSGRRVHAGYKGLVLTKGRLVLQK